ncbi:MAG: peptidoglycan bridge formation protein FemAB, partial [Phycisphaerales bacterium]|nr:peptidoglycan bridge formation protein FemAB [Phycisphaerales bacterium]
MENTIQIVSLTEPLRGAWEAYLLRCPQATVFHRLAWCDAVEAAYGHRPLHRLALRGEQVVGVLPMMLVRSRLVGRVIVSVPYATYGGIVSDDEAAADALLAEAQRLCAEHDVEYLELRQKDETHFDLPTNDRYDTFRCELPDDPAALLPAIPKKGRAACRKGLKQCDVVFGRDHLDTIYDLYAFTMRRLGSPNFSKRL